MIRPLLTLILGATLLAAGCSPPPEARTPRVANLDEFFERDELTVVATDGTFHTFNIYLATSFEQQRRGLMFVRELPEKTGMLFVYDDESMHSMWMKNTYIPLDIVFARRDGTVSSVIHDTEPLSLNSLSSIEPVTFVLELGAGVARQYKIGAGSRLDWIDKTN
ncbi:MAG: DUF192 domain-containing protein [Woeseiaceae bacterium]